MSRAKPYILRKNEFPNITDTLLREYGIEKADVKGKRRDGTITECRHILMYIKKECTNATFKEVGNLFGGRDHSTAVYAKNKINDLMDVSESFRNKIEYLVHKEKTFHVEQFAEKLIDEMEKHGLTSTEMLDVIRMTRQKYQSMKNN